jgi:hypothetical protein
MRTRLIFLFLLIPALCWSDAILVPMDDAQTNHLKAYGVAYWALQEPRVYKSEWLLNYRGGSFLIYEIQNTRNQAVLKDVTALPVSTADIANIHKEIELNNMDVIPLERAPKMAVYTPPTNDPWDDAVTLALTYAEIPYDQIWDDEVLGGVLSKYDWLHLHHEDFTGQYGKFYRSFHFAKWYQDKVRNFTQAAQKAGFAKVQDHKLAVAKEIRSYVNRGGFMFAMCAATDTLDIALASEGLDIVAKEIDGDGLTPSYQTKLNFANTLAFKDFKIIDDPMIYEFSDIDTSPSPATPGERYRANVFQLFDFSAKFDPVPTMLTQNHVKRVDDFWGQTTAFRKSKLKSHIITLADFPGFGVAKYIHGVLGEGTFTFLGGHDPEDAQHLVGDEDTDLSQHPHSPGYRLILNNVLFPAAKKKPRKT